MLHLQCGQGSTDDELSPTCVSSLLGIRIESVAAGLWHTVCISADGDVYAFGGNQFGQLGTGAEQAEVHFWVWFFCFYPDNRSVGTVTTTYIRGFRNLGNMSYSEMWFAYTGKVYWSVGFLCYGLYQEMQIFSDLVLNFYFYLCQTLPRLLDAPNLENMHVKVVSCGARHTAVVTGMTRICILKTFSCYRSMRSCSE